MILSVHPPPQPLHQWHRLQSARDVAHSNLSLRERGLLPTRRPRPRCSRAGLFFSVSFPTFLPLRYTPSRSTHQSTYPLLTPGGTLLFRTRAARFAQLLLIASSRFLFSTNSSAQDWPRYGGTPEANHFSSLTQIDRSNVTQLKVAWTFDTREEGGLQSSPLIVNGVLYGITPIAKNLRARRRHRKTPLEIRFRRQRYPT